MRRNEFLRSVAFRRVCFAHDSFLQTHFVCEAHLAAGYPAKKFISSLPCHANVSASSFPCHANVSASLLPVPVQTIALPQRIIFHARSASRLRYLPECTPPAAQFPDCNGRTLLPGRADGLSPRRRTRPEPAGRTDRRTPPENPTAGPITPSCANAAKSDTSKRKP